MAFAVEELVRGPLVRDGSGERQTRHYKLQSDTSEQPDNEEQLARAALLIAAPASVPVDAGGLFFILRQSHLVENIGPGLYFGTVEYASFGPGAFRFEIGGGSRRVYVNDVGPTLAYPAPGRTAPQTYGLIGINGDSADGCEVPPGSTACQFEQVTSLLDAQVTPAYLGLLTQMLWAVNDAPFYGLAAGEALFLGASGHRVGDGSWDISFTWAGSPNRVNFGYPAVEPLITGINKGGWDYLWVLFEPDVDPDAHRLMRTPVCVYVEQLLPRRNFAQLGIGTTLA